MLNVHILAFYTRYLQKIRKIEGLMNINVHKKTTASLSWLIYLSFLVL